MITDDGMLCALHGTEVESYRLALEVAANLFRYLSRGEIPVSTCEGFAEAFFGLIDATEPTDLATIISALAFIVNPRTH